MALFKHSTAQHATLLPLWQLTAFASLQHAETLSERHFANAFHRSSCFYFCLYFFVFYSVALRDCQNIKCNTNIFFLLFLLLLMLGGVRQSYPPRDSKASCALLDFWVWKAMASPGMKLAKSQWCTMWELQNATKVLYESEVSCLLKNDEI